MKRITLFFSLLLLATPSLACTLKMGYRTTARLPNIAEAPNNEGVYKDLYTEASKRIGCALEIHRLPKKRILRELEKGSLDFYPGLTFTELRSKTISFFSNGLPSHRVGLTRKEVPTIDSYMQLKNKTVLIGLGSPSVEADKFKLTVKSPAELDIHNAIEYILNGKADFYEDDIGTLSYYLKDHPRAEELIYHFHCSGEVDDLTVGFSRASQYMKEEVNTDYDPNKTLDSTNFPQKISTSSVAYRLQQALVDLKREGVTDRIFLKYYGININDIFTTSVQEIQLSE